MDERPSLSEVAGHALSKLRSYFCLPLGPLVAVVILFLLTRITFGVLSQFDVTLWVSGVLWVFPLLSGFAMTLLLPFQLGLLAPRAALAPGGLRTADGRIRNRYDPDNRYDLLNLSPARS